MDVRALPARLRVRGRAALARRFGIDARALAALRVVLGALLLVDLLLRARYLVAFYTDFGVLPRAALREQYPAFARFSLHAVSGDAWVQAVLFVVAGGFAVALLCGYRTTLVTVVSFLLLASLHARNPLVLNGGDSLLRRLLFWGVFLPLGGRWSVDALRDGPAGRDEDRVASVASAALLVQVVVVYTANAAFKLRGDLWVRGDAIRYVFSLDQFTVLFGDALARYPAVLVALDRAWLALLLSSVLLVLLTGRARTLLVALFVAMHVGMALTMRLGLFPLISIAALLPFLPGPVWDALESRLPTTAVSTVGQSARSTVGLDRSSTGQSIRPAGRPSALPGVPSSVGQWVRRVTSVVVAVLLVLVLAWNAATLGYVDVPDGVEAAVDPDERRWDMFAPSPPRSDGWYVVPGRLESGGQVDAYRRAPVQWDRPPDVAATYPTARWRKYLIGLWWADDDDLTRPFAGYLCRRWNSTHDDDLVEVTVYVVEQPTRLDGPEPTRRIELLQHACSSGQE